ncbi:MAG: DUF4037 domain-containing protein [Candidatus Marinimicrobia bacterium]|nr:DUF4037 domain-containing protein [Candidatus Neomarinimicrobiota bacterium]
MRNNDNFEYVNLANKISEQFKIHSAVEAIALGGSQTSNSVDNCSDVDLYIYTNEIIPLDFRNKIVQKFGSIRTDLNLTFWDLGDEWLDKKTGVEVDVIYWDKTWIEEQIDRVLISHQASVGYTTCFWHTVSNSKILFDRRGWFSELQNKCLQPYPKKLRNSIIAKNHPVLRNVIPSYRNQVKKAIERDDFISVNHRIAALLASYFDILFAINHLTNPGEKKILSYALERCTKLPKDLSTQIKDVLQSSGASIDILLSKLDLLLDSLDEILVEEGIDPTKTLALI